MQANIDPEELTIQINQYKALNAWPAENPSLPYNHWPQSSHSQHCIPYPCHGHHHDYESYDPQMGCFTTSSPSTLPPIEDPSGRIDAQTVLEILNNLHINPSLPPHEQHHFNMADVPAANLELAHALGYHYTLLFAMGNTIHSDSNWQEASALIPCDDHTQPPTGESTHWAMPFVNPLKGYTQIAIEATVINTSNHTSSSRH